MASPQRRFSSGMRFLDSRIDGGLGAGGLLALTAPPVSQSELLLREFLLANRTLYVTTIRPEEEVREWATATAAPEPDLQVRRHTGPDLLESLEDVADALSPESFLIIDTATPLETAPRDQYLSFLNELKALLRDTDSVGVLHCIDQTTNPPRRALTLTRADHVWQLQTLVLSREIKNQLLVTKARNGRALSEPIDLLLTDRVRIDTSRKI